MPEPQETPTPLVIEKPPVTVDPRVWVAWLKSQGAIAAIVLGFMVAITKAMKARDIDAITQLIQSSDAITTAGVLLGGASWAYTLIKTRMRVRRESTMALALPDSIAQMAVPVTIKSIEKNPLDNDMVHPDKIFEAGAESLLPPLRAREPASNDPATEETKR